MTHFKQTEPRRRRLPRAALLAALLAAVTMGTALASGLLPSTLKDWFSHQWSQLTGQPMGEGEALAIDRLTQPVGVRDTAGGLTVTLDSVTVGDSVLWLLLKAEGDLPQTEPFSDPFRRIDLTFGQNPDGETTPGGYGYSCHFVGLTPDGKLTALLHYSATLTGEDSLLTERSAELVLTDFMADDQVVLEGEWRLPFAIEATERALLTPEGITVPARDHSDGADPNAQPVTVALADIRISATGIRFTQAAQTQMLYPDLRGVQLADGTEIPPADGGARWSGPEGAQVWASDYNWKLPVDLSQVTALRFGEELFPVS